MTTFITSGADTEGYVELASRQGVKPQGRLFKKQILHWGSFRNPNDPNTDIQINEDFAKNLVTNFSKGVCDIVQVPVVDEKNKHVEDPFRNIGRVIDVDYDEKGIYAYIDAMKHQDDLGKTLIGASAMMSLDYTDTKTGEKVGPTLLHCAVTNRPYLTNLDDYQEIVAASAADTTEDTDVVLLTEAADTSEETPMTLDEILAKLKEDHGIDVTALQAKVAEKEQETAQLSNVLGNEDGEEITLSNVAEAVVQLAAEKEELKTQLEETVVTLSGLQTERDEANRKLAENEVDGLVKAGRILPKQRDKMVELSIKDRETFETLLPEDSIVQLSEEGVTTHEDTNSEEDRSKQDAVKRYLEMADAQAGRKKN
jgi:hypothetical protein